jgi:hypothetical protein
MNQPIENVVLYVVGGALCAGLILHAFYLSYRGKPSRTSVEDVMNNSNAGSP